MVLSYQPLCQCMRGNPRTETLPGGLPCCVSGFPPLNRTLLDWFRDKHDPNKPGRVSFSPIGVFKWTHDKELVLFGHESKEA